MARSLLEALINDEVSDEMSDGDLSTYPPSDDYNDFTMVTGVTSEPQPTMADKLKEQLIELLKKIPSLYHFTFHSNKLKEQKYLVNFQQTG